MDIYLVVIIIEDMDSELQFIIEAVRSLALQGDVGLSTIC